MAEEKASKTKLLNELAEDVTKLKKVAQANTEEINSIKSWIKETLKPSLATMRTDLLADIEGMKTNIAKYQELYKEKSAELTSFRNTIESQRLAQSEFQHQLELKLLSDLEKASKQLEEKIQKESNRLWKLFEEHKPKEVKGEKALDEELDLLEARLEQYIFKEINRHGQAVEQDIQHVEERLEQVIFREVLRLKNYFLAQQNDEKQAAEEEIGEREKEVQDWLKSLGLAVYLPNFIEKGYDSMFVVKHVLAEDLDAMKILLPGHRKAILLAVGILNPQRTTTQASINRINNNVSNSNNVKPINSRSSSYSNPASVHENENAPYNSFNPGGNFQEESQSTSSTAISSINTNTISSLHKKPIIPKKPQTTKNSTNKAEEIGEDIIRQLEEDLKKPYAANPESLRDDKDEINSDSESTAQALQELERLREIEKERERQFEAQRQKEREEKQKENENENENEKEREREITEEDEEAQLERELEEVLAKQNIRESTVEEESGTPKPRPPVANKPSSISSPRQKILKKSKGITISSDDDENNSNNNDADFENDDDLLITQKPKKFYDLSDARALLDCIFNGDSDASWGLFRFENEVLKVFGHGKGDADELASSFQDTLVLYGYLRTTVGAEQRNKYVLIRWVGDLITPMARAKAVDHKNVFINQYLKFYHVEILANQRDEITSDIIKDRIKRAGGANYDSKQNETF